MPHCGVKQFDCKKGFTALWPANMSASAKVLSMSTMTKSNDCKIFKEFAYLTLRYIYSWIGYLQKKHVRISACQNLCKWFFDSALIFSSILLSHCVKSLMNSKKKIMQFQKGLLEQLISSKVSDTPWLELQFNSRANSFLIWISR